MAEHNLLGMIGYDAESLPDLFGQHFQNVKPIWSQFLEPSFDLAQTALGALPELRGSLLGQLTSGLQERGVAAGRGLQSRRAGAGFAGSGALDQLGQTGRRGLEQEFGRGSFRIGQDIAQKEAGILGALSGKVGGFLQTLLAAGTEAAETDTRAPGVETPVTPPTAGLTPEDQTFISGLPSGLTLNEFMERMGVTELTQETGRLYSQYRAGVGFIGG